MSNGRHTSTPLQLAVQDAQTAFRNLEFAIKLLSHCELKKLDAASFDSEHTTRLREGDIVFPIGNFSTNEQLVTAASISVLVAFSVTVLALDQAFDAAGIGRDPGSSDNLERLRVLVYMMRNAVAHCIAAPVWLVNKPKYQVKLRASVTDGEIEIDLPSLNGKEFLVEDIGGYVAWYRLRDTAMSELEARGA